MESNSVYNHTSDWQNRTTTNGESHLSITSLKKKLDIGYTFSWKDNGSVAEMRDNSACIWHALSIYTGMTCQLFYSIVQLQAWHLHCPIGAQIELVITNHMPEFCYSFDRPQNRFQTRLSFVTAQRFRSIIKAKKNTFLQNKCTVALINVNCWWYILLINFTFFQHVVDFSVSILW